MPKPLKAGGEVDSWCTKCKLFLNHRIIAMVGSKPVRVECSTCSSHHNFRARPPGDAASPEGKVAPAPAGKTRTAGATGAASRVSRGAKKAEQERADLELSWEKAISGKGVREFRAYRVSETFQNGELVRHSKFGDGVVTRIVDAHKVEVLFKAEAKTLAQGLVD